MPSVGAAGCLHARVADRREWPTARSEFGQVRTGLSAVDVAHGHEPGQKRTRRESGKVRSREVSHSLYISSVRH